MEEVICRHFGVCGGCACVTTKAGVKAPPPHVEELQAKEQRVRTLLAPFEVREWRPIVASPELWRYRNKVEVAFAPQVWSPLPPKGTGELSGAALGFREGGHFERIVDLETCFLMSEESLELVKRTRAWAREYQLVGFERRAHKGDLRYLVIREGKNTGQRMGILIVSKGGRGAQLCAPTNQMVASLTEAVRPLTSTFIVGLTDARGDVARAEEMTTLWGPGTIAEKLNDVVLQISPYSFFQTNTHATEKLYGLLQTWGREIGGTLVDVYCGSGGITLSLARSFERVLGVDSNKDAIQDASANAARNGITNAEFVAGDAVDFLKKLPASKLSVQLSAMIVDPPRAGLHPKALQALVDLNPPKLAYVSCNPESLARDLQILGPLYRIQSVQPVDLFPHTAHVETMVTLEHR